MLEIEETILELDLESRNNAFRFTQHIIHKPNSTCVQLLTSLLEFVDRYQKKSGTNLKSDLLEQHIKILDGGCFTAVCWDPGRSAHAVFLISQPGRMAYFRLRHRAITNHRPPANS